MVVRTKSQPLPTDLFDRVTDLLAEALVLDYQIERSTSQVLTQTCVKEHRRPTFVENSHARRHLR
jgi:hypothetical protein